MLINKASKAFGLAPMLIHMDVMAASAIPAIAAFGHPAHHMPIMQEPLSVSVGACQAEIPTEDHGKQSKLVR